MNTTPVGGAPPPRNPKLQYCLENYVRERFIFDEQRIGEALEKTSQLDLSYLPKKLAKETAKSFEMAATASSLLDTMQAAKADMLAAAPDYRPIHRQVRRIEANIRRIDTDTKSLKKTIRYLPGTALPEEKRSLEDQVAQLGARRQALEKQIPIEWSETNKAFKTLQKRHRAAQLAYRRAVDNGYTPVSDLLEILQGTPSLRAMHADLEALRERIQTDPPTQLIEAVSKLSKKIKSVSGTGDITSPLSKARRALKSKTPKPEKALKEIDKALKAHENQMVWRDRATGELMPVLAAYERVIRDTIGARAQTKMSPEQALYVASCSSGHRDISLSF